MDTPALLAAALANGKTEQDLQGLAPELVSSLGQLLAQAPQGITINSAYRSPERQAQLFQEAIKKYGSEQAARKWVAPPGKSQHNHGNAVDLGFVSDEARNWAHQNAQKFGLAFPMGHEPWHIELANARGMVPVKSRAPDIQMAQQATSEVQGNPQLAYTHVDAGSPNEAQQPNMMASLGSMLAQSQMAGSLPQQQRPQWRVGSASQLV